MFYHPHIATEKDTTDTGGLDNGAQIDTCWLFNSAYLCLMFYHPHIATEKDTTDTGGANNGKQIDTC